MPPLISRSALVGLGLVGLIVIALPGLSQPLPLTGQMTPTFSVALWPGQTPKQGTPILVKVQSGQPLDKAMVTLGNLKAPLFKMDTTHYQALIGLPVDMSPHTYSVQLLDASQKPLWQQIVTVLDGQYRKQNISVSKSTASLKPIPGELEAIQALKERLTLSSSWPMPFISPTIDCKSSPFGVKRYHNGVYIHDYHKGVDLRAPAGRPIKAITSGQVIIATQAFRLHGGTVGLDHGLGLSSIYIHMSKVAVKPGDIVKKGDTIGYVGSTGFATGPHLHWGLFANGVPINPDVWISVKNCS